ncbi:hypothetical protein MSG28_015621 [Choristoneura fumiferana]|uniref:Uncharacterized protein n=1 Tax=Choristoneura fumiferana TaxID=7141 RepID=A0ACC0KBB3_CHOFU|nr:hypothetical protein MSG28_015621 [Choristoneura fumiferana]
MCPGPLIGERRPRACQRFVFRHQHRLQEHCVQDRERAQTVTARERPPPPPPPPRPTRPHPLSLALALPLALQLRRACAATTTPTPENGQLTPVRRRHGLCRQRRHEDLLSDYLRPPLSPNPSQTIQPRSSLSLRADSADLDAGRATLRPRMPHQSYSYSVHTLRRQPRAISPPSPPSPWDCLPLPTHPIPPPELFDF